MARISVPAVTGTSGVPEAVGDMLIAPVQAGPYTPSVTLDIDGAGAFGVRGTSIVVNVADRVEVLEAGVYSVTMTLSQQGVNPARGYITGVQSASWCAAGVDDQVSMTVVEYLEAGTDLSIRLDEGDISGAEILVVRIA